MDTTGNGGPRSGSTAWGLKEVIWLGLASEALFLMVVAAAAALARLGWASSGAIYLRGALMVLGELAFVVPLWGLALRRRGIGWRELGLRPFRPLIGCLGAATLLYLTFSVNLVWALVLRWLHWPGQPDVRLLFGGGPLGLAMALVGAGVVAPLAEELFFRGFAFPPLRQRLGLVAGIAADAGLFALAHFTPTVFPPIFALGVFFCLLYEYTGSLWPGMMLHAAVNALAVLAAYLLPR
jgi:hypothetical protein